MTIVLIAGTIYALAWLVLAVTARPVQITGAIDADFGAPAAPLDVEMVRKAA